MKKLLLISVLFCMVFVASAQVPNEPVPGVIDVIKGNWDVILGVLFAVSEVLALIPGIKANSVFQLLFSWLKSQKK